MLGRDIQEKDHLQSRQETRGNISRDLGVYKASEGLSFPKLGLVSLKKARMIDWSILLCDISLAGLELCELVHPQGPAGGGQKSTRP